jgi:deoxyribodipyrimidine photo-lyase
MESFAVFWFRRDLRLYDNAGLFHALKNHTRVVPLFIFDTTILNQLEKKDARVEFIHTELSSIKRILEEKGGDLLVYHDRPVEVFRHLLSNYRLEGVYANEDYEPYARRRDQEVKNLLSSSGVEFHLYKDQVIFARDEVVKANKIPYTVFTPYMRKWKSLLKPPHYDLYDTTSLMHHIYRPGSFLFPSLKDLGFLPAGKEFPPRRVNESVVKNYHTTRDFPFMTGTTRLSIHLRFGTVSIRELVKKAVLWNDKWLDELIWREFYKMILWHFPHAEKYAFKPLYDNIHWRNDEKEFEAWCHGQTGYPIVDAGMRELAQTGFMHNRVRMITASFLVKHLLLDWRWGETWFANKLLDYDLSSNNGGWQWAASTGCDAVPYFRIFNPALQEHKFDPHQQYIKKWVPEINSDIYPKPIVDHDYARMRAIMEYKRALTENE